MFAIEPIDTANLITIAQTLIVVGGFYLSWRSLEASRKSSQAQLFNQMVAQGRELQFRFSDVYMGGDTADDLAARRAIFVGALFGYYSYCFESRRVLPLPENVSKLLDSEIRSLMQEQEPRERWEQIKHNYSQDFIKYVEGQRGVQ